MKVYKMLQLLLLTIFLGGGSIIAQQDPLGDPDFGPDTASRKECLNHFVYMHDHAKQEQYEEAISGWRYCFSNCPKAKKTIYTDGEDIIIHKIKHSSGETKKAYVDTLMQLYDQRIKYFGQEGYVLSKKGTYLAMFGKKFKKAYEILDKSIEIRGVKSSKSTLKNHMNFATKLANAGALDKKMVVEDFTNTVALLEKKLKKEKERKEKEKIKETINAVETLFTNSKAASCDILEDVYKPKFKKNPDDKKLMVKITSLLEKGDCTESKFYAKASERLYELRPSAGAAYHLSGLFKSKENYDKAISYLEEAIEKSNDSTRISEYYQEIGNIYYDQKNNNRTAVSKAKESLKYNPQNGAAYILMGLSYADASNSCTDNSFFQSAVYWVAVDKFQKAKKLDPSIAEKANKLINAYSQNFPTVENTFMTVNKEEGDTFNFNEIDEEEYGNCWINEITTVRTTKR